MTERFDVAVIGAGVVGSAIARALSRQELQVALIDAAEDVGTGTSKANTAILHTGFDAVPGSMESQLLRRSYPLMKRYATEVGIALEETGALLVAWSEEERQQIPAIVAKAVANGVADLQPLSGAELYAREPNLGPGALSGIWIPGEAILCPFTPVLAYATEAVRNGAQLSLGAPVQAVRHGAVGHVLSTPKGEVEAVWVVNAAGLFSDVIDRLFGHTRFTVTPRRGELIVYDKLARSLLSHILLPIPTKTTKGVLVSPTVFGNVLLGPTAENLGDKTDSATSEAGLASLVEKGKRILPLLTGEEVTATYAGLRAATERSDYQLHVHPDERYICVGGIRSTGLSASLGIAEWVLDQLRAAGLALRPKPAPAKVRMPWLGRTDRVSEDAQAIGRNPDYGRIVCHCEQVSRGELLDALSASVPATSLDGLRRRTRCLQGRCQGFYCLEKVSQLLDQERGSGA